MFVMLLFGVVLPVVLGGTGVAGALWLRARGLESLAPSAAALGVGLGVALAQPGVSGSLIFPPVDAASWLLFFGVLAALTGALQAWTDRREVSLILAGGLGAWLAASLLAPRVEYAWGMGEAFLWSAAVTAALVVVFASYERVRSAAPPSALSALLAGSSGVLAPTLIFGGSLLFGQLSGALACALTLPFLASFSARSRGWIAGLGLPAATIYTLLLASGVFFAELPLVAALVALASPVIAGLAAPFLFRRLGKVPAWIVFEVLALAPALAALGIAFANYEAPSASGYGAY